MLAADFAFAAALVVVIGCNLYFGPRIGSDKVAMQWGLDGNPTWYAPKWLALWGMVAFMLAVRLLIWAAMTYIPQYVHGVQFGVVAFSVGMVVTQIYILNAAVKAN
jgi:Protein of unknown function (DUF1648)